MSIARKKPMPGPDRNGCAFDPHVPGVDYGPLDRLVGYAIRRAQIRVYEDFEHALGGSGITPQRYAALTIIRLNPELAQCDLGHVLGIARSGATILINALVKMNLVARAPQPGDRRAYRLVLTEAGRDTLEAIDRQVLDHDRRIAGSLSEGERRTLMKLLDRIGG